jgi:macrolide-specific efflux system membrane fusion protein
MHRISLLALAIAVALPLWALADDESSATIELDSVLITLIEQAAVPAREAGVLTHIEVREGDLVDEGAFLARIDDEQATLAVERAKIDVEIARKQSENDIKVRYAKKSAEVAAAELKRSTEAVERFNNSVSQTELDRLRLASERSLLEIEQSQYDLETSHLTTSLKESEHKLAKHNLERRRILAPIAGAVVEISRNRGEWVEVGETVVRILRVDRLRAEGFLDAKVVNPDLAGRLVTLHIDRPGQGPADFPGKLVFVSPEVNPINGQVRVWAEVENRGLFLRPGLQASLTIHLTDSPRADRKSARNDVR